MGKRIHTYYQLDSMDCGPTCLRMIARFYGKTCSAHYLREHSFITREGVSMLGLSEAAEMIGMKTLGAKITIEQLSDEIILPCILHWNSNHFVVCYHVKGRKGRRHFYIEDPVLGKVTYDEKEMQKHWISGKLDGEDIGLAMQVEPAVDFDIKIDEGETPMKDIKYYLRYITPHKNRIAQMLLGSFVVMMLSYFTPFLSQSVVDIGIKNRDMAFIMLIMLVQVIIAASQISVQFVQSWMSLHMNTVININLISDYLAKLTRMPLHFFEVKTMGDILQRIGDHSRIKNFLMNNLVDMFFSIGTFIVFSAVLAIYNWKILLVFIIGNGFYLLWILAFMKYRRELDNKMFTQSAKLQNNMVQFIQGMREIKLNCIERQKRWEWEHIQAGMYRISTRALRLSQIQSVGSLLFSNVTGIMISYLAARMVVTGEISLGMMMSLSFIIGQVSGPIGSFINFAQSFQDAKISLERLNDINSHDDEMKDDDVKIASIPKHHDIKLDHVFFSYNGAERNYALQDITLTIAEKKVTAIVGASGSGKTTLIKLLQGFYDPLKGILNVGSTPLSMIKPSFWRKQIGAVMQDGFIFSDTIANNICINHEEIDQERLQKATSMANLTTYINSLPLNYSTKIGDEGVGLSQGQRQRILLARAIYKNPHFIFLDEATNALDTQNEKEIMDNLHDFYNGKTVVVVAHRLSTVKDADTIIVLNEGKLVEQGTHEELIALKGSYFKLVQNQLELGNE